MGPEILAALLGIPVSWFAGLTLDKIKTFVSGLQDVSLDDLFIKTFYGALDAHKKEFPEGVKKLKKAIKEKEEEFIEIFSLNIRDYNSLISALQEENFHETVARQVVEHFGVEKNFREVMVIIVRGCLRNYRAIFLKTISEKQALQMILLLHGQNLDVILKSLEKLEKTVTTGFKKALKQEAVPGAEIIEPKRPPVKQIKILSITASPEDELQYEKEQDTLLQAFRDFDRERVFLDIPDPVKDTLTEIAEHLQDGKHDILHITAHGSLANQKGEGVLSFETEAGEAIPVTGAELAKILLPAPKIVILCACHSAGKKPELMPVAEALREAGIESVIGMKKAISHEAAIEFNRG
ncbi:MAG: CHAT domain-containing protein, partial [Candidatus Aminicenantes bacterium]|nr:CHAT domain-containing protein [Candidatus Aminicenantes bacterium]